MKNHDVYAFGMVSSSTLYRIREEFPAAEGYAEIDSVRRMTGGEAANSSIVLSRLGASVKLAGNWIGGDEAGQRTLALLDQYDIDVSSLRPREGYEGASEVVVAAGDTRTIFGTYIRLHENAEWDWPNEDDVKRAKVVCLDPFFGDASLQAAEFGADAGVPVVTVDCPFDSPIVPHASALVIAESFIRENYGGRDLEELFGEYQSRCDGLVVFTFGSRPLWYADAGQGLKTLKCYAIEPVDTTGGGDSFRAGVVYGYLQGWEHDRTIEFASAVAAMVCTRSPGVLDAPTLEEVRAFMSMRV